MMHSNEATAVHHSQPSAQTKPGGYRLVTKDFETRIEPVGRLDTPPDFITTFPPGVAGYVAAHDEAIAYLEDVIADCLETLKELKDSRWINAMELQDKSNR